ncbi:hypothetical protein [Mycolicibacter heraklionensis]|nr:hypothetical protein [Mycolicibacter heraklionensis]
MSSAERTRAYRQRQAAAGRRRQLHLGPVLRPTLSAGEKFLNTMAASVLTPHLRGAACLGLWSLFDPRGAGEPEQCAAERHQQAIEMCADCPALAACSAWVGALPARERPTGVVAGLLVDEEGH